MIGRTIESLKGAKRATVHIYLATSDCFRNVVFGLSKEESKALAVKCTKLVRQLTKDDPSTAGTDWDFEFSPETFSDTDLDYAVEVCEAVKEAWGQQKINQLYLICQQLLKWPLLTYMLIKLNILPLILLTVKQFVFHCILTMIEGVVLLLPN